MYKDNSKDFTLIEIGLFQTRQPKGVLNAHLAFFLLAYCLTFLVVYLGRMKLIKINLPCNVY